MILPRRAMMLTAALLVLFPVSFLAASPRSGYHAHVNVTAPTRLDWSFVVLTRSLPSVPADWLPDYEARRQQYELFVPPRHDPRRPLPLLLFVSPGSEAMGWKHFEGLCKKHGFLFAGPHHAGNDCPPRKRVRIVLDVLDDIRRQLPVDADRTYLVGFSGGGRIASGIAFALPEYFGGVMSLGAAHELRGESWLRQRVIDRLSVMLMAGENDFNRGEVERWRGPLLKEVGVRTHLAIQPGLGHQIPSSQLLEEGLLWLEEGASQRDQLARRYPATRVPTDAQPSRETSARALFAEAKRRLDRRETLYSGLMQMQGCMQRWPDLEVGVEARKILQEYEERKEHSWEAEDIAEQRRFLIAEARALDAYASGDLPSQYERMRQDVARKALELWQKVLADTPDNVEGQEARKRIPTLERLAHMGHS